jgi:hypothetical protein
MKDTVLVLSTMSDAFDNYPAATKKWIADDADGKPREVPFSRETYFEGEEHSVNSFDELAELLTRVSSQPHLMVTRGSIAEGTNPKRMRRTTRRSNPATGAIAEESHYWLALDIDSLPLPHEGFDPFLDAAATVAFVKERLPAAFRDATCWYAHSSGAGFKAGIRLRLAFWLDRPIGTTELKVWLGQSVGRNKIYPLDTQVFFCGQPIYIAAPVIVDLSDPLGGHPRCGIVRGSSDTVTVPEIEQPERRRMKSGKAVIVVSSDIPRSRSFKAALGRIGDHDGGYGCYEAIKHVVGWFFHAHGGTADVEALTAEIKARVAAAQWDKDKGRTTEYFAQKTGRDLDNLIRFVQRRQRDQEKLARQEKAAAAVAAAKQRRHEEGLPLAAAERKIEKAVDKFYDRDVVKDMRTKSAGKKRHQNYTQAGIKTSAGTGKTYRTIKKAVAAVEKGIGSIIAVPAHVKAEEAVLLANELAGREIAAVWRGEARPDPDAAGELMCRSQKLVKEARAAGLAREDVCKVCPFKGICGYHIQERKTAPIWVVAHALLFTMPPKTMREHHVLIIDEAIQVRPHTDSIAIDALTAERKRVPEVAAKVAEALRATKAGTALKRETLAACGVTWEACRKASKIEKNNFPKLRLEPGNEDHNLTRAKEAQAAFKQTLVLKKLWDELAAFLGGTRGDAYVSTRMRISKKGDAVEVSTRKELNPEWLDRSVLALDATLDEQVARVLLPRLKLAADVRARFGEGVTVRQVHDDAVAYYRLRSKEKVGSEWVYRPEPLLHAVMRKMESLCARTAGEVGLIAPKSAARLMEELWTTSGTKPANLRTVVQAPTGNLETISYGVLRGLNALEHVQHVVVLSRPEPPAAAVEHSARVLFDHHPERSLAGEAGYPAGLAALRMADGSDVTVRQYHHTDRVCRAILEQAREAELIQALSRGRPVRRTADTPLVVEIVTSTPLQGLTVDEVTSFEEWLNPPRRIADLLVERGMVPEPWEGKWAVLRDLYPTVAALKMAAGRQHLPLLLSS